MSGSKSKFSSHLAERMYTRFTAEEEISSENGGDWLGLYKSDKPGGIILHEDTAGFVSSDVYTEDGELWMAWEEAKSIYAQTDLPAEDDYVIHDVPGGYSCNLVGGIWPILSLLEAEILKEMAHTEFYPDVWFVTDHGNFQRHDIVKPNEPPSE